MQLFGTTGQSQNLNTNPGQDTGRDIHYFFVKIRDGKRDGMGHSLFPVLEHLFLF